MHRRTGALLLAWLACASGAQAQLPDSAHIYSYRYVLDTDVPAPAALDALGLAGGRALRASAPKPLAAHAFITDDEFGIAADVSPYFILGGGRRTRAAYRAMDVRGRLMRVLTKATLSAAVLNGAGNNRLAFGLRSTIHDPHEVTIELADSIAALPGDADLTGLFVRTRERARAKCCMQIALGVSAFESPRSSSYQYQLWGSFQHTAGDRIDIIGTPRMLRLSGDTRYGVALGALLKSRRVDVHADVSAVTHEPLTPSITLDAHLLRNVGATASWSTHRGGDSAGALLLLQLRTYYAHRH